MQKASVSLLDNAVIQDAEDQCAEGVALDQPVLCTETGSSQLVAWDVNRMFRHQMLDKLTICNRCPL
eukprot:6459720-Amphidinium_carterae.1